MGLKTVIPIGASRATWVLIGATLAVALLTLASGGTPAQSAAQLVRYGAAIALLWILPAIGWYRRLQGEFLTRMGSALGLAFMGSMLATLGLHLVPGPFPPGAARAAYLVLGIAPLLLRTESRTPSPAPGRAHAGRLKIVLGVVLVALLLRTIHLGYSEFQGDEAVIMQRAAQALSGNDGELFLHQKGPVEILVPMSVWALSGSVNEWQVRLPFALAGLMAVIAVMALAATWFDDVAALSAGSLVAINGFLIAFARIVQYQNFVIAMGGLGLLWLLRYRRRGRCADLMLAAAFVAFGLLAHYDAVLVGPAALVIVLGAVTDRGKPLRGTVTDLLIAAGAGAAILSLFYVPFIANPVFSRTFAYLNQGRLGEGLFHNSLWSVWRMSTFYNSLYYVVGLLALVLLAGLLRSGSLAAWLYFVAPFAFYSFIVADPRTHVYTFFPGAAILAGGALSRIVRLVSDRRGWLNVIQTGVVVWVALCAGYATMAFVSHAVEYKREWPESRVWLYPVPFADAALPPYGHFGFPYRAGWKAVESLFAQGTLEGTYASNEEPEITTWYVRSGARTMCGRPDVYIVAENVQDEIAIDWEELARDYVPVAEILVRDAPKIVVYQRAPVEDEVRRFAAREGVRAYDLQTTVANQIPGSTYGTHATQRGYGNIARLLGYDLDRHHVKPGETLMVTLYWQALSSPQRNYQVFTHLMQDGELVGQHDGAPACAHAPTSLWEVGDVIRDEHVIPLDETVAPGDLSLYVGLYDLLTYERLPISDEPVDDEILTRLEVMP